MALLTCPHGHHWEGSTGDPTTDTAHAEHCPVCGITAETVIRSPATAMSLHEETLAPQSNPLNEAKLGSVSQIPTVRTKDIHADTILPSRAAPRA